MPVAGPWFFAWVDANTAFNPSVHNRMDEYVFSVKRSLAEGDKPSLEVEIKNPHIGLLNPSRKFWAWVSRADSFGAPQPFFYGRVVAVPSNLFAEVITIQFVAWPIDYFQQQQRIAETIKVSGPYDAVFIDVLKRDDPDTILEAVSKLWCVDPITLQVTVSDILSGEDGNVVFTADEHFYDGMSLEIEQPPLTSIRMDAQVSWTQTARGYVDTGNKQTTSGTDGLILDWPKPLTQLGAGWSIAFSFAQDSSNRVAEISTRTVQYNWQNTAKQHANGDGMSISITETFPDNMTGNNPANMVSFRQQSGVVDPFAVDENGDPSPLNIPASADAEYLYHSTSFDYNVGSSLVLRYDAARPRTERVIMLLQSDLQSTLVDPLVTQNTELMTKSGADVGIPIINLLNWTTVSGTHVDVGQVVFPDQPTFPGGRSVQRCVTAGTAGAVEPDFSDIPGTLTNDNTVVWSSLGVQSPTETSIDWTGISHVPAGEIILPHQPLWVTWLIKTQPGRAQSPAVGVGVSLNEIVQGANGYFFVCVISGDTGIAEPVWPTAWGALVNDGVAQWACIGAALPDGKTYFLATTGGTTGSLYQIPPFNNTLHATTADGSVVWTSIGTGDIPVGGTMGNVTSRAYFPTARGQNSIQYLVAIMRARMLYRARAVRVGFECTFDNGLLLSCRKTATCQDTRLPGGAATGKVTGLAHSVVGDTGVEACHVTIGCAVGHGNSISPVTGTSTYVNGYVGGYRATEGSVVLAAGYSNVGYTPPIFGSTDDGLVFPLDPAQVVLSETMRVGTPVGSSDVQRFVSNASLLNGFEQGNNITLPTAPRNFYTPPYATPVYYDLVLKPVNSGPFFDVYNVTLTPMTAPKGIDLEAGSTP